MPPRRLVSISVPPDLFDRIETARGFEPRSAWITRHLDGRLAVDETQRGDPVEAAAPAVAASRRPRAAEQAERSRNGSPPADSPGVPAHPPAGDEPAGCPECGADVTEGKCVDCGWLA